MTEVLDPTGDCALSPKKAAAKQLEIRNLIERGTFKFILKYELPSYGNILPGRFLLAIKSPVDGKVMFCARYVIGSHHEKMQHLLFHSSVTSQLQSVRLLLGLTSIVGFHLCTADGHQA